MKLFEGNILDSKFSPKKIQVSEGDVTDWLSGTSKIIKDNLLQECN